jgi:hypothetical protein
VRPARGGTCLPRPPVARRGQYRADRICLRKNRVQPILGFSKICRASRREKEHDIFGQFFKTGVSYFCCEFGDAFMYRMRSLLSIQSQPKHFGGNFLQRHADVLTDDLEAFDWIGAKLVPHVDVTPAAYGASKPARATTRVPAKPSRNKTDHTRIGAEMA